MTTTPVLAFPNNGDPFTLDTSYDNSVGIPTNETPVLAFPNNGDPFTLDTGYDHNTSVGIPK